MRTEDTVQAMEKVKDILYFNKFLNDNKAKHIGEREDLYRRIADRAPDVAQLCDHQQKRIEELEEAMRNYQKTNPSNRWIDEALTDKPPSPPPPTNNE